MNQPTANLIDAQQCYKQAANLIKDQKSKQSIDKAITYLTSAAEQGLAEAQYQMGVMYTLGEHVVQNQQLAFDWFNKASNEKFVPAQFALATLHISNEDYDKAFEILTTLAHQNVTEAQTNLADLYLESKGVEKDVTKAITLLNQAATKGDRLAQYRLGQIYYQGKDTPTDYIIARKHVVMAMEQRYLPAYLIMGSMLEHGFGIEKDVVRAYTLYCYCRFSGMPNLDDLIDDVFNTFDDVKKQQAIQFAQEYCQSEPTPI